MRLAKTLESMHLLENYEEEVANITKPDLPDFVGEFIDNTREEYNKVGIVGVLRKEGIPREVYNWLTVTKNQHILINGYEYGYIIKQ